MATNRGGRNLAVPDRIWYNLVATGFVAAVSVMNTIYTHYFLPVVMMLPLLLAAISSEMEQGATGERPITCKKAAVPVFFVAALCAVGALYIASYSVAPAVSQGFYSKIYNMPSKNVWGLTWQLILPFSAVVVVAIAAMQGFKASVLRLAVWTSASFVAASVVFAAFPAVQLAPYVKTHAVDYFAPMTVSMFVSALFLTSAFGFRERLPWRKTFSLAVPMCMLSCYVATPGWRASFRELVRPGTHHHETVARELAALLPKNAIVIGERSNQMLMSLPIRTATTFAANSDPIPVVESILKSEPDAKLYALADSQHSYNLKHYREHAKEYRLRHIKTFKMPSFGSGTPSDVYLAAIEVLPATAR